MNKFKMFFRVFIIFLFTSLSFSQESFEGKVDYKITNDDETTNMSYFIKEGKMKINVEGQDAGEMIFDSKNKKMLILMPEEKMYMEMSLKLDAANNEDMEEQEGSIKKTGEKKEILGYTCEKWIYQDDDSNVESWLTKELGSFIFFTDPMAGSAKPEWQSRFETEGYFPMEVIVKDDEGDVESTMVVTSVEKKSLDKAMFEVPGGFQKLEIPGMN